MGNDDHSQDKAKTGKPSFVWVSTEESVKDGTFSFLACCEVVLASCIYLVIILYFATLPFWWMSILMLPIVLLRSRESVDLGKKWIIYYWNELLIFENYNLLFRKPIFWLSIAVGFTTSFIVSFF
jgi:hypothetical protein